jgi:hypothetical protein
MGRIDCHMLCIVGVALGNNGGAFVFGMSDAVVEEQVVTLPQLLEHLHDVLAPGSFLLPAVLSWVGGYDGFLSVDRAMGLGTNVGVLVFVVGLMDMESIANTFFTVIKTGGVKFLLQELSFRVIVVHLLSSSFLSSSGPAHCQLLPKLSFSAYPPNSAKKFGMV